MLDHSERGSNRLITHSTSVVTLVRGLGRSFSHLVSYHVKSGAKGGANMAELNVLTKHMHAHVDVPGVGLVRGI
jgi:phage-related tail protein